MGNFHRKGNDENQLNNYKKPKKIKKGDQKKMMLSYAGQHKKEQKNHIKDSKS